MFYQIYPRSFADGDGDGVGDFEGMIDKLDYLQWLGVDAVWLSPHFPSPNADWGYDVADYHDVHPELGALEDFDRFLAGAHERGIRVVLDLVLNHTSDQHPWFLESRSSKDSPKRDWYVWHPGKASASGEPLPPNNWESTFGGPAWEYDEATGEWYYHFFVKEQPDLNWHNPEVREAMWNAVRFWYDRGADGFRLDAIGTIFEDPDLTDHDAGMSHVALIEDRFVGEWEERRATKWMRMFGGQVDLPEVHDVIRELRVVNDEYPDRVLIGETNDIAYLGDGTDELHLVFNFGLKDARELTPEVVRRNQAERLAALPPGGWACTTMGNHDTSRVRTTVGGHPGMARVAAALVLLLPGTPSLYYGEEIGMENYTDFSGPEELLDPIGPWYYRAAIQYLGMEPDEAAGRAIQFTRDRCRTPMQWNAGANAGFTWRGVEPWLPVHPNHEEGVNVADQEGKPDSLLEFYRTLILLRRSHPALREGSYRALGNDEVVFAFERATEHETCIVAMNLSPDPVSIELPPSSPLLAAEAWRRDPGSLHGYDIYVGVVETDQATESGAT